MTLADNFMKNWNSYLYTVYIQLSGEKLQLVRNNGPSAGLIAKCVDDVLRVLTASP